MKARSFKEDYLKFIFSFKLKSYRQRCNLSISELADKCGMSISYLSEIEKGLKYPKPERIAKLSQALSIPFDDLVTVKLDNEMSSLSMILNSAIWNEFPFEQFGISIHEIFKLLTDADNKAAAFVKTIYEIGKNYEMQGEHFLLAALRSFQLINSNHFPQAEEAAENFIKKHQLEFDSIRDPEKVESLLVKKYGITIDWDVIRKHPPLNIFRSIYKEGSGNGRLIINPELDSMQRVFILFKEAGYHFMELSERARTFTMFNPKSFAEVFNNFLTSYFAGAVLMRTSDITKDLGAIFAQKNWHEEHFSNLLEKYKVTPETFLHRLSQILPKHFNFKQLHFMRMFRRPGDKPYLDKELNNTDVFTPRRSNEHHCSRWLSVSSLDTYSGLKGERKYGIYTQRSVFLKNNKEFFNFTICRTLNTARGTLSSMTLGIQNDGEFKRRVRFWDDPAINKVTVNETCERCPLDEKECTVRKAEPAILYKEQRNETINQLLAGL